MRLGRWHDALSQCATSSGENPKPTRGSRECTGNLRNTIYIGNIHRRFGLAVLALADQNPDLRGRQHN